MSIGQGYVLATPLQVLVETMAVANGGTIYEPRVVHHMTDANGGLQKDFEPVVVAFKELLGAFRCGDCQSWLHVTPARGAPEGLRCQCSAISMNLKPKSK